MRKPEKMKGKELIVSQTVESTSPYATYYSEEGFWRKVAFFGKKAGRKVLEPAAKLYFSAIDPDTPTWARTTIFAALGYFILPADAIADLAPVIGYSDDLGILLLAIGVVAGHIKPEHREKAQRVAQQWLGENESKAKAK